jgi:hypothetical protein
MPYPKTRLEQLAQQSRMTVTGFRAQFAATARRLAEAGQGRPLTVSDRQVQRWFAGRLNGLPHLSACRVLDQMFGEPAELLFGPPRPLSGANVVTARQEVRPPTDPASSLALEREIAMAAAESARFGQFAEQSNVGPHTLEQFRADIERIATNYGNRPVYPTFVEVRELRNRAFELLEGRQRPDQTRDLYLVAGLLCAILGESSYDLGLIPAAKTQFRTAFLCGELAGNNWLRAWVRGRQSDIAYWTEQPRAAAELATDAWQYVPEIGTARAFAASQEARARARLRDQRAAEDALARAEQARDDMVGADDPGGCLAFPLAAQTHFVATTRLLLGGQPNIGDAERQAARAVELYQAEPPERRELGRLGHARLGLAAAQLGRDDLEGAAAIIINEVLTVAAKRPSETITRRLRQLSNALERPRFQTTALALDLRDQIRTATAPVPGDDVTSPHF